MKTEIKKKIEELDNVWTVIIECDDQISNLDRLIIESIKGGDYQTAFRCETEKNEWEIRMTDLRQKSSVLERLIMAMLLEE